MGASGAKVAIHYASNAPPQLVQEQLGKLGLQRIAVVEQFHMAYAEMPLSASSHVAALPWVLAVNLQAPPAQMNNYTGRLLGRAATLQKEASLGGRSLLGRGVKVGIWDGNVTGHVDFGNRVHAQEFETPHEHGVHVAGTALGAGMVDPDGEGMAPKAEAWTYNFNRGSNGLSAQQEMALARDQFGITLTQNSYGISLESICAYLKGIGYFDSDYSLDLLAYYYPTLTHVFAAGNDQIYCEKNTEELWGATGYGTATTRAKNAIHVGAVTHTGVLTEFSSLGPQDDGRMFPSICAKGYNVWSTGPGNDYMYMNGTSQTCPTVTGTAALLSERYAQLHQGQEIPSDLLRAILANTATDAGRPGPDFQYGFGIMNGEKAAIALENQYHAQDAVANGENKQLTIQIPAGCQELRVMLVWNDPPSVKADEWGDRTLVNDLDLSLTVGSTNYLPWVCDPTKGNLLKNAVRNSDHLNNIEQITLTAHELQGAR